MAYKLIEKFKKIIGSDPVVVIHASISPLFMNVAWSRGEHPIPSLSLVRGRDNYISFNERRYFALATDMFRRYYEGKVSIEELEDRYREYERHAQEMYDEVTRTDLGALSDDELKAYMDRIDGLYTELLDTIYIETIDYDKILSVIGAEHQQELDKVWEKATQPTFVSFEGRYLRNMTDLVSSGQEDTVREARFMFTDYSWTKSSDEIIAALAAVRDSLDEKRREVERLYAEARAKEEVFSAWEDTLSPRARRIAAYTQMVMWMRDARKDPIAQMLAVLVEIATIMTKRADIELRHAPFIQFHECVKGVEHLKQMKAHIEAREEGSVYLAHPDKTYEIEHRDFEEALAEFNEWTMPQAHESSELRGQIACRGQVRGIVRVVSDPHD
ncbi:MAG: hypothetical protein WCT45_00275, partial [Candidatus Paceibacterota bacterium]